MNDVQILINKFIIFKNNITIFSQHKLTTWQQQTKLYTILLLTTMLHTNMTNQLQ